MSMSLSKLYQCTILNHAYYRLGGIFSLVCSQYVSHEIRLASNVFYELASPQISNIHITWKRFLVITLRLCHVNEICRKFVAENRPEAATVSFRWKWLLQSVCIINYIISLKNRSIDHNYEQLHKPSAKQQSCRCRWKMITHSTAL